MHIHLFLNITILDMNNLRTAVKRIVVAALSVASVCVLAVSLISRHSSLSAAKADKYDRLIKNSSGWSARRTMDEADRSRAEGDQGKALVLYMSVVEKLASDNSPASVEMAVQACMYQGDIYMEGGNYGNALKAYLKGLGISENSEHEPHIAMLYKDMAAVYNLFRDYGKKRSLETKGLSKAREHRDTAAMAVLLNNLARGDVAARRPKAARRHYEMLAALGCDRTPQERYANDYTLAMVVRAEGDTADALRRFHNLAARSVSVGIDPKYICSVYNEIFWIYNDIPELQDSAEHYLRKCVGLVKSNGLSLMFIDEIKVLSDLYHRRGDEAEAMKWKLEYLELVDSVYIRNVREVDGVRNQQFLYEMGKAESQINRLWQEKRHHDAVISRQRWIIFGTLAGVVSAAFVIWYIVSQHRKLSASYRSLYSLNKTLGDNHLEAVATRRMLEEENDRLRGKLASVESGVAVRAEVSGEPGAEKGKYCSSNLGDGQKRMLARRISEAMENDSCGYCDVDFTLGVLSDHVGSNVKYVSQVINDVFGKSFSNYVNEYRVREACDRLSAKGPYANYSVKGIGESVGFKSHSTFVGVFRKITGMTPSVYRKMSES